MPELLIRKATELDLARVGRIWYEAATEGEANPPPVREVPSLYVHELATRELIVAECDGEVVAYGAVINRGAVAFLADLFVASAYRSMGFGQRLLQAMLPTDRVCCTVASNDPRALPLYARSGMRPWWPHIQLLADSPDLRLPPIPRVETLQARPDDMEWVRWDAEISARPRPQDRAYWLKRRRGVALWFERAGRRVGYGMAQYLSDDSVWRPDTLTLGPVGALDRADAADCVLSAVHWGSQRAARLRISLTGPHAAIAPLLAAGFRVASVETFCCTGPEQLFVDVQRYVSSGADLF